MGWNSWDSFGPTLNEDEARANAAVLASELLPYGYKVFTVDIQWYEPGARSYEYRRDAELVMDEWGRLLPAPNRFPSAAGGAGVEVLAVNQRGRDAREINRSATSAVWAAGGAHGETYVARFNLRDPTARETASPVSVSLADLELRGPVRVRDLWRRTDDGIAAASLTRSVAGHGACLLRLEAL